MKFKVSFLKKESFKTLRPGVLKLGYTREILEVHIYMTNFLIFTL